MAINVDTITLRRPDDWHVHLRDGAMLAAVIPFTARHFARAIVMPNLVPPVTDVAAAHAYRDRILAVLPAGAAFTPLMTCYLTDATDPQEVARGWEEGAFAAVKLYPAHATTNSAFGVTDYHRISSVLERMAELGMPLLIHGEVTDPDVDVFDREAMFIDRVLDPLRRRLPELRIVLEHITTEEAVAYVEASNTNLAATITAHHLVIDRNAIFAGGIRPHLFCLPIAKRAKHRRALRLAATSGNPRFFLGTDSAPHPVAARRNARRCFARLAIGRQKRCGRIPPRPRKPPAVAPGSSRRLARSKLTPKSSKKKRPSTAWKPSPRSTARLSTAVPPMRPGSHSGESLDRYRSASARARTHSSRFAAARHCAGGLSGEAPWSRSDR